jgi:hypothetical protein
VNEALGGGSTFFASRLGVVNLRHEGYQPTGGVPVKAILDLQYPFTVVESSIV